MVVPVELKSEVPATVTLFRAAVPVAKRLAIERSPEKMPLPWTERTFEGVEVPIPTSPLPSMTKRSLVPTDVELDILNFPPSARSVPMAQLFMKLPSPATVLDPTRRSCGEFADVEPAWNMVSSPVGVVVPTPTLPAVVAKYADPDDVRAVVEA